ncbi:LamG domain-containing protein [Pontibacter sp. FD36]|uniref:LamG-like jellyroll fold domain-containing protein n=1 Tax=Pontibacter sp. FD36 TaxID=2789860 RepID=UPI0018AA8C53|nr:LamG-like jellyroll fold domain-containing protein [Pontibacter sp. FD36]MBF8962792.1 LamG domain-containing protein [Pontibacter sp. FD36]
MRPTLPFFSTKYIIYYINLLYAGLDDLLKTIIPNLMSISSRARWSAKLALAFLGLLVLSVGTAKAQSQTVCAGSSVTFRADISQSNIRRIQWQVSTNGTNWNNIQGATNSTYTFIANAGDNNKRYKAIYEYCTTFGFGICWSGWQDIETSVSTLTVNAAIPSSPSINALPICSGSTATLSVSSPINGVTYSWYTSNTSTTPTYEGTSFNTPSLTSSRDYYVSAGNSCGQSTRTRITVTVNDFPNLSTAPTNGLLFSYPFSGNADDASGNNNGTVSGATSSADRFGNANSAYNFNGSTNNITTPNTYNPRSLSISLWFNTTTNRGGKLAGFGGSRTGSSSQYDRHIYMADNGQLYFGVYNGGYNTINTSNRYNDGNWHHVVATISSTGMVLYVDGVQQATNSTYTTTENFNGYFRIGYDNLGGWPSEPTSSYFQGQLDDIYVYDRALTSTEVNNLRNPYSRINQPFIVCQGGTISLSTPSITGASYAW